MIKSTSPLAAPMSVVNFSQIPSSIPSLLLSANVFKKFLTVSPLSAPPICFCSSCTIWDLSPAVRVGAVRILGSLGSFLKTSDKAARDLDVVSRADNFTAAVYWRRVRSACDGSQSDRKCGRDTSHIPMHLRMSRLVRKEVPVV